jgi:phage-related tail protein
MVLNYTNFLKINISKAITDKFICKTSNIRILKYSKGEQILDHLDIDLFNRGSCTLNLNEDYISIVSILKLNNLYQDKVNKAMQWSRKYTLDAFENEIKLLLQS